MAVYWRYLDPTNTRQSPIDTSHALMQPYQLLNGPDTAGAPPVARARRVRAHARRVVTGQVYPDNASRHSPSLLGYPRGRWL